MSSSDANRQIRSIKRQVTSSHDLEQASSTGRAAEIDRQKRAAAEAAVRLIEDGMIVGLGTGSTAEHAIRLMGERCKDGLDIVGVPTSRWSESLARTCGIPVTDLQASERVDITIDGADEVERDSLWVLKGRGGALVREKLVALASERVVIIADSTKLVDRLGFSHAVPVEVLPFGWRVPASELVRLGGQVRIRTIDPGTAPFTSDNGNLILDVAFGPLDDPKELARSIKSLSGVVDHGLFIDIVDHVFIGNLDSVDSLPPER